MNQEEQAKKISQIIAKCWADEDFKQKVLANPAATLRAEGLDLPADLSYVAHENTEKVIHLIIPAKPTDLSDENLAHVAGGTCQAQAFYPQSAPQRGPGGNCWPCVATF
jgi:Nitrile hydratase, alpha chain